MMQVPDKLTMVQVHIHLHKKPQKSPSRVGK